MKAYQANGRSSQVFEQTIYYIVITRFPTADAYNTIDLP